MWVLCADYSYDLNPAGLVLIRTQGKTVGKSGILAELNGQTKKEAKRCVGLARSFLEGIVHLYKLSEPDAASEGLQ